MVDDNKCVIAVNNGTSALHALYSGICLFKGKKLRFATQSFTFPIAAQGVMDNSIIVDIDESMGPSIKELEIYKELIDGVVITNLLGHVLDIQKYIDWCEKNNKILLLDNAATSYSFYKDKNSINYGTGSIIR